LLSREHRTLGNSILQSGASLGAIATPQVILLLNRGGSSGWRLPFQAVGAAGVLWVIAWLTAIRPRDLEIAPERADGESSGNPPDPAGGHLPYLPNHGARRETLVRRFLVLVVVVVTINLCWQYFRAWMPMMLEESYGYSKSQTQNFSSLYYFVAGAGCILVGLLVKWLSSAGWTVHRARTAAFSFCALLTAMSAVASRLPASGLLLASLLAIGFGSLGQFPAYYAFSQELSVRQMGKITGVLSFLTWTSTALAQELIGWWIHKTGSYAEVTLLAGLVPLLGWLALLLFWNHYKPTGDGSDA
jgi:ACS family hexuronate transporter-like MFS transporter